MKLFTTSQIASIDQYTIEHEPIKDIDLMERAASEMFHHLVYEIRDDEEIIFFAGPGNNGGDTLAMARMFAEKQPCTVYRLDTGKPLSGSAAINWQRLVEQGKARLFVITSENDIPGILPGTTVVDGLFGSGLARPLEGLPALLVRHINRTGARVIAIDIPSGLMGEDNSASAPENIIRANLTLTLQFPKLSLLFPENERFAGRVEVIDIGLHPDAIERTPSPYSVTESEMVASILPPRTLFSHKGTYGHALLIAGSKGKSGAAVLASRSCLRAGAGLLTVHLPSDSCNILQTAVPEAMASIDPHPFVFSAVPSLDRYTAVGAGPGIGTSGDTSFAVKELLSQTSVPLVLDADALNILSENREWLALLPENSILTPHPGEFRRLAGETSGSWQRLQNQREMAQKLKVIIVLKGAWTTIALPDGELFFNPTGNPGMATGGSGDVLTGIILGLLAQGVAPAYAAIAGVYLHGLAGDLAARKLSQQALIASDIIAYLGKAFLKISEGHQQEF